MFMINRVIGPSGIQFGQYSYEWLTNRTSTIWAPILFPLETYDSISEEEDSLEGKYNVCFVSPSTIAKKVFLLQCDKC